MTYSQFKYDTFHVKHSSMTNKLYCFFLNIKAKISSIGSKEGVKTFNANTTLGLYTIPVLKVTRFVLRHNTQPAIPCPFKVNNRNTKTRCEICSKLIIKTPQRCHWRRSSVYFVNFEHVSHLFLVFLLLTLST